MRIANFSVDRPVTIVMFILALLVLGLFSLRFLSIDLLPEITNPTITISASYPGAGPQEVEHDVTKVIESVVGTVSNVEKVNSTSQAGSCLVFLQFTWGANMDTALADVRARLELVRDALPDAVKNPAVYKFDTNMMPILGVAVSGRQDQASLKKLVDDEIQPALERVEGVAAVYNMGGLTREIEVLVDPMRLQQHNLSIGQVSQVLRSENIDVSGGVLPKGGKNYTVRGLGKYESVDQIKNIPVTVPGGFIHISDIAEVKDTFARQDSYTLLDGRSTVSLFINKQSGSNTVEVADKVEQEFERLQKQLPGEISFVPVFDTAEIVRDSINDVARTTILGGSLAVVILLIFLRNLRTTIVIATAIPFAIITTFILMYFNKMTLNMMSMGGLALGVGHMVDYSIVVLESVYRYHQNGYEPKEAAKKGTAEVGMAVVASALTVAVVFLPMVFVKGLAGVLFKQFALTVAFSQLAALFVSLTLIPLISSRILGKIVTTPEGNRWWQRLFRKSGQWYDSLDNKYRNLLVFSLKRRFLVVAVTAGITLFSLVLRLSSGRFMPPRYGANHVDIEMPVGTTLAVTGGLLPRWETLPGS